MRLGILLLVSVPVTVWNTLHGTTAHVPPARVLLGLLLLVPGYLVGRHVAGTRFLVASAIVAVTTTVLLAGNYVAVSEALGGAALTVLAPWFVGRYRRQHLELAERLRQDAREAARRERTRIAREAHDSLGHDLALIAVRAGALEVSPGLTEQHQQAVAALRECAAQATERLHEVVTLLRDDTLQDLVERTKASGVPVTVTGTSGHPLAYEVVREALTNAAKHAPGEPVEVTLDDQEVVVRNGLRGLEERVRQAGGTFEVRATFR
ncbi:sensor histidine kinase [Lentzea tibetensis]|uniref:sensor histidine kinase n=1 Tax=Lentzea tibetensis TaxID=2591470 RepID=UPI001C99D6BB|nr:histidine kinase [Lentzea tibetensis]